MEDFLREGTDKTPFVSMTSDGQLIITGTSMPEDTAKFYFKIMDWLSDYFRSPAEETSITISLRYLNSSSCSTVYKLFHFMNRLPGTGRSTVSCHWRYETDDVQMKDYMEQIKDIADQIEWTSEAVDKIQENGPVDSATS